MFAKVKTFSPSEVEGGNHEEEKCYCPKCGAEWVKTEPTLVQVRSAIREATEECVEDIKALRKVPIPEGAVNPMYGYAGSVAIGTVNNPEKLHYGLPPDIRGECGTKYDIDGFMITDFASRVRKFQGKRWASRHRQSRGLETKLRKSHKAKPALAHMRGGKSGYSLVLYTLEEEDRAYAKSVKVLVF